MAILWLGAAYVLAVLLTYAVRWHGRQREPEAPDRRQSTKTWTISVTFASLAGIDFGKGPDWTGYYFMGLKTSPDGGMIPPEKVVQAWHEDARLVVLAKEG